MRIADGVAFVEGDVTLATATGLLGEGIEAIGSDVAAFDLAGVTRVDSSALSLLLSWQRNAQGAGRRLELHNLPESLLSLAELYGIGELIA